MPDFAGCPGGGNVSVDCPNTHAKSVNVKIRVRHVLLGARVWGLGWEVEAGERDGVMGAVAGHKLACICAREARRRAAGVLLRQSTAIQSQKNG